MSRIEEVPEEVFDKVCSGAAVPFSQRVLHRSAYAHAGRTLMKSAVPISVAMLTIDLAAAPAAVDDAPIVVLEPRRKALLSAQLSSIVVRVHKERGEVFLVGESVSGPRRHGVQGEPRESQGRAGLGE